MTERLDKIKLQQETNTANIADLIVLSGNVLRAVDSLTASIIYGAIALPPKRTANV